MIEDFEAREKIVAILDLANGFILFEIRDQLGVTVDKIRATVFFEGASIEVEKTVHDKELFEKSYMEHVKREAIRQAKDIIKHDP